MKNIVYQRNIINISREELIDRLRHNLSDWRFNHVLRVEQTALELADKHGADDEQVSIAALMHDYAKEMDHQEMFKLAQQFWDDGTLDQANDGIWHGFAAAQICRTQMGCQEPQVLNAIASHTTGWTEMTQIGKIIYLADYIEPFRDFKGIEKLRKLAKEDLDQACYKKIRLSIKHLMKKQMYIYPVQLTVYNVWTEKINQGIGL
ncbi:bis(5'-nucleosyl)-tetraphosphatase (symmetrical) YqeK [Facklamia sp. DSM 111018]|uniref:bis(5'-nucleosyl)-tetraphosphatase (symmetrical) n=1 Tax=Facklamia lactis TaxID=2749967 RepID=A0ABS0LRC5_9LACT|nr:bis(5'-nucleosyl)-tetraphosphatase (symmetrical) YqeK [Facklamia lactis]MBG9980915.1 bis(5'-nucleosyl)-tetraphosphatase (symmetrical) YqeK [Facklamia lactis]MBG9986722.1 bis(5'-nucleosyl)-tetraphosphatase (symmetrical) YqeK [Facklamia lactis]